jgi:hypothetical protein
MNSPMNRRIKHFVRIEFATSFLSIFIFTVSHAQIMFQKTYGGTGTEYGGVGKQTFDGGYFICGRTNSFGTGGVKIYFVKTDSVGSISWSKIYGGTVGEWGNDAQQTIDGGYIIAGTTGSFGLPSGNVYLIKTNSLGNTEWSKTYGGISDESAFAVQQTNDSGYILTGYSYSSGVGNVNFFVIKTNAIGDTLWTKSIGGNNDYSFSIQQTSDGGFIVLGETFLLGIGDKDVYLIKLDSNGNLMWSKTYGGTQYDRGYSIQQTNDGGYIITGQTQFGTGDVDVYLIKTNNLGNILWSRTYGGSGAEFGLSVQQTIDDGYIIGGYTNSFGSGDYDFYLIKTDSTGTYLWSKTFGGTGDDEAFSVQQTLDNGFLIAGYTTSFGGSYDLYLIKTDVNGNSGCNENNPPTLVTTPVTQVTIPSTMILSGTLVTTPATIVNSGGIGTTLCPVVGINDVLVNNPFFVFSNTTNNELTIQNNSMQQFQFTLYNSLGGKIIDKTFTDKMSTINLSSISSNIYYYKLSIDKQVIKSGKIIKQ